MGKQIPQARGLQNRWKINQKGNLSRTKRGGNIYIFEPTKVRIKFYQSHWEIATYEVIK